jgi:Flp pilus assembly protein TadB
MNKVSMSNRISILPCLFFSSNQVIMVLLLIMTVVIVLVLLIITVIRLIYKMCKTNKKEDV